jgi:hypothetical protein
VDLLELTSSGQLFSSRSYVVLLTKQTILMRRSTVLSHPFQQEFLVEFHILADEFSKNMKFDREFLLKGMAQYSDDISSRLGYSLEKQYPGPIL